MSMHLEGPWLSTTGKKKGRTKYRNAEAAARARQTAEDWKALKQKHGIMDQDKKRQRAMTAPAYTPKPLSYRGSELPRIPSLPFSGDVCARPADKVYTGDAIVGISTMHKSNAVPVFSNEAAKEISRMRRG